MPEYIYIDKTLYELAYDYLLMKSKKERRDYTVEDLFFICAKILKKVDDINKRKEDKIIQFKEEGILVDMNWLQNWKTKITRSIYHKKWFRRKK